MTYIIFVLLISYLSDRVLAMSEISYSNFQASKHINQNLPDAYPGNLDIILYKLG